MNLAKLFLLFPLLFGVLNFGCPAPAWADEDDDIAVAQRCLDNIRKANHQDSLACVAGIERYSDAKADFLKCGGHLMYGGLDFFQYPWFLDDTVEYPLVSTLNHVSDLDLDKADKAFAQKTRTACYDSGHPIFAVFSDFVWLRAVLLEVSRLHGSDLSVELAGLTDQGKIDEIETSLQTVVTDCKTLPTDAMLPVIKTSFCFELLRLDQAPGVRLYDRLVHRLKIYG